MRSDPPTAPVEPLPSEAYVRMSLVLRAGLVLALALLVGGLIAFIVSNPAGGVPWDRVAAGLPLYQCRQCRHYYWEGSHTANIRRRLETWSETSSK